MVNMGICMAFSPTAMYVYVIKAHASLNTTRPDWLLNEAKLEQK